MFQFIITLMSGFYIWLIFLPYVVLYFILFLLLVFTKIIELIARIFGVTIEAFDWNSAIPDHSNPKCRRSKRSFWGSLWFFAKNPDAMVNIIKKVMKYIIKKSKIDKITCRDCKNLLENQIQEKQKKKIFTSEKEWKIFLRMFYHILFATYNFLMIYMLYNGINPWGFWAYYIFTIIMYITAFLFLFADMIFMNKISSTNHMTLKTATEFISNLKLKCKLHITCYHTEGTGDDAKTVITWEDKILVPVTNWLDTGRYNYEDATEEVENILKRYNFFTAKPDFDCKPEDKETEETMQQFKGEHKELNKHRDDSISTKFIYELTNKSDEVVKEIVVHRDGFGVPESWFNRAFFNGFILFAFLIGLSPLMMVILYMKSNRKRMIVPKNLKMSNSLVVHSVPQSGQDSLPLKGILKKS